MSECVEFRYGELEVFPDDPVIGKSLRLYGEWAQKELDVLFDFIRPGSVVLDIGSFIGTHAVAFSKTVGADGKVYSFEPRPEVFDLLSRNLGRCGCANAMPMMAAVGEEDGVLLLGPIDVTSAQNFGGLPVDTGLAQDASLGREVQRIRIDSLALPSVDLVKIDVEGMEPEVLRGAKGMIARCRPVMSIECNSLSIAVPLQEFAAELDYEVYGLIFDAFNPHNYRGETENMFGRAREASLLLLPKERVQELGPVVQKHALPRIDSIDAAALLLMHKPQYANEVLDGTPVAAVLGTDFYSARAQYVIGRLDEEVMTLKERLGTLVVAAEQEAGNKGAHTAALESTLAETQRALARAEADAREYVRQVEELRRSHSWRLTYPVRLLSTLVRRVVKPRPGTDGAAVSSERSAQRLSFWEEFHHDQSTQSIDPAAVPVDIIVPVYRGLEETQGCIESVLTAACRSRFELIVINDCSPEPEVTEWLRKAAAGGRFTLLENEQNLGFVGTVNRGMSLHPDRDVVLLNSDALVANDWLDRLVLHVHSNATIGTVTPFSTNATICSYPKFCEDNELPLGTTLAELDQFFRAANTGYSVEVPTGVGFCMLIKRSLLDRIGLFDMERFGKGYGEENDFCQRAVEAGYKNVLACDTFVQHLGAVSFGSSSNPGKERAMEILRGLHPHYERDVHNFIARDPVWKYRLAASLARLKMGKLPVVLHILHSRGGGTQQHVEELARVLAGSMQCLVLKPSRASEVELTWMGRGEDLRLSFDVAGGVSELVQMLRTSGVSLIHFHHTIGLPECIRTLPEQLGVPFRFTVHDYYSVCPQISLTGSDGRYCGEQGVSQCEGCLKSSAGGEDIVQWRETSRDFFSKAQTLIAPSRDVATRMRRYFPELDVRAVAHPEKAMPSHRREPSARKGNAIRVVVLGALSKIKGADQLEAAALDAAARQLPIEYVLVGYAYRDITINAKSHLKVLGAYQQEDLAEIVAEQAPDLIWFPAVWPETFSYTLSFALAEGYAIAAPDLGAFPERLVGQPGGHVLPWDMAASDFNNWLLAHFDRFAGDTPFFPRGDTRTIPDYYANAYRAGKVAGGTACDYDVLLCEEAGAYRRLVPEVDFRGRVLNALREMRVHPLCSWIVKQIPHNLQRRIRDRLVN